MDSTRIIMLEMIAIFLAVSFGLYWLYRLVRFVRQNFDAEQNRELWKFLKHCIIPEKFEVTGKIVRLYDNDNVLIIDNLNGIKENSVVPSYYLEIVNVDNFSTIVEIRDFSLIGKLRRRIDDLDTDISLPCRQYSLSDHPFV